MMDAIEEVKKFYDDAVQSEWDRLERHSIEFEINKRFMLRYIKQGDKVLDIGGGPGRYSLYLAEKGCNVTLVDLSDANILFAEERAGEKGLSVKTICGDARVADTLVSGQFDHVLLMGPLYHLTEETDRIKAVTAAMRLLKLGGILYSAFISSYAGLIYLMKHEPERLASNPQEEEFMRLFIEDRPFEGIGFTHNYFYRHADIEPFMSQFPLEKLHLLGSEAFLAPCEPNILSQPPEITARWIDLAEKVCEREDLLSFAEHYLYIGRKKLC